MFKNKLLFVILSHALPVVAFAQEDSTRAARSEASSAEAEARSESRARATRPPPSRRGTSAAPASASTSAAATPAPERRGFFQRLFGRRPRAQAATPTPAPRSAATTVPAPGTRRSRRPSPETSRETEATRTERSRPPKPAASSRDESVPPAPGAGAATSAEKESPAAAATASGARKKSGKDARPKRATPPPDLATPEAQEKWKYDEARKQAMEDADVQALKQKADATTDADEGRRALRAYNKALFNKMRSLEPSVKDRIDAMETAVMKRLGE